MAYFHMSLLHLWCCALVASAERREPDSAAKLMRRAERREPELSAWPAGPGASALQLGQVVSSVRTTLDRTLGRKNGDRVQEGDPLDDRKLGLEITEGTNVTVPQTADAVATDGSNTTAAESEGSEPHPASEPDPEQEVDHPQTEHAESVQIKSEDLSDNGTSEPAPPGNITSEESAVPGENQGSLNDTKLEEIEELSEDWVPEKDPASEDSIAEEPTTIEEVDAEIDAEAEAVEADLRKFEAQDRPCRELSVAGIDGYNETHDCDTHAACRWVGSRPPEAMDPGHCLPVCSAPPNQERARCENGGHSACLWVQGSSGGQCVAATGNKTARQNEEGAECLFFSPAQLGHQHTLEQCASRVLGSQQCGGLGKFMFNRDYAARNGGEGNCFCCRGEKQSHNVSRWGVGWDMFTADVGLDAGDGDGSGWDVYNGSTAGDFGDACAELTRTASALGVSQGVVVTIDCAGEAIRVMDVAHQDESSGVLAVFLIGSAHFHDDARSNFTFELLHERPQVAEDVSGAVVLGGVDADLRARVDSLLKESELPVSVSLEGSLEGTLWFKVNGSELLTIFSRDTDGFFEALEDKLGDSSEDHAVNLTQFLASLSEEAADLRPWRDSDGEDGEASDADLEAFRVSLQRYANEVGTAALGRRLRSIARGACAAPGDDGECWQRLAGQPCDSSVCHSVYVWLWRNAQRLVQHWEDVSEERGIGNLPPRVRDYAASFFVSTFADRAVDLLSTV